MSLGEVPCECNRATSSPNLLPSLGWDLACSTHPHRNPSPVGTSSGPVGQTGWLWVAGWPLDSNAASKKPICCRVAGGWTFYLGGDLTCGAHPHSNPTPVGTSRGPVGQMGQLWVAGWPLDCNAASRKPICPIAGGLIKFPPIDVFACLVVQEPGVPGGQSPPRPPLASDRADRGKLRSAAPCPP